MTKKRVTGFVITAVFMISMVGTSIAGTATGRTAGGTLSDYVGINVFGYSKTTGISSSSIKSAMARFTITSSNFGKADKIVSK